MRPRSRHMLRPMIGAAMIIAIGLFTTGCYERTIAVRGPGAERTAVQEPYQETWLIDNFLLGEDPTRKPAKSNAKSRRHD